MNNYSVNKPRSNQWEFRKNKANWSIHQFLRFTGNEEIDDIVNLDHDEVRLLIIEFVRLGYRFYKRSTIEQKLEYILYFYSVNGFQFSFLDIIEEIFETHNY